MSYSEFSISATWNFHNTFLDVENSGSLNARAHSLSVENVPDAVTNTIAFLPVFL